MGASQISICNQALAKVGGGAITSLTEGSTAADACRLIYDDLRDEILQMRPWPSSVKRTTLAKLVDPPAFEWASAFKLPPDFLAVWRLGITPEDRPPYAVEGRTLLTNLDQAHLVYVFRNEDPASYEPALADLLATRMAMELAVTVAANASLKASLMQEFEAKRLKSHNLDGHAVGHTQYAPNTFVEARRS